MIDQQVKVKIVPTQICVNCVYAENNGHKIKRSIREHQ